MLLLVKEYFIFDECLLVDFLIVLDFLFNFVEEVGVDDALISSSVGFFLEAVDFGDFLIVFVKYLLDIVLHFLDLLLEVVGLELLFVALHRLHFAHFTLQQRNHL